jgi:phosphoglycerol transferase MdoB-like AlkP superfamily enzyme
MNHFFSHNGFDCIDRLNFAKKEITFENAWGVCDEDLFHKALSVFNQSYASHKPFFGMLLTTSNHRPFTYPEGRVDIPSHTGRNGGVKYTDYAIGRFIREAEKEPWFKDTLFIIVADHCAESAGQVDLPVKRYEIPLLMYSPAHISPQRIDKLASQIDIAPTVLGLLNFSYQSQFFGKNILEMEPEEERAFIGTYQKLGYMKKDRLVVLGIKQENCLYRFRRETGEAQNIPMDPQLLDETVGYYQGADFLFRRHLNRWNMPKRG